MTVDPTTATPARRRISLAAQICVLAVSIAVLTSAVAALISVNLLQRASERTARAALVALADQAQANAQQGASPEAAQARTRRALQSINVQVAVVRDPSAPAPHLAGEQLATRALTPEQIQRLVAGQTLSLTLPRDDSVVLVEARPTPAGGIVLAQRRGDAVALADEARRQLGWLLLLTGAVAAALGLFVAWRLSRPLRRTAAAARALARGEREVAIPETGPTEVADVARSVNQLSGALSHSEGRQREFLLSVSHDLRTPLTAITGYAESLADGVVPPERIPAVGAVVGDEARRLERMVTDLLDLARLDAADVSMDLVPVDLVALVETAEPAWRHRCEAAGLRLRLERCEATGTEIVVRADPQRLRQALDGLFDNALRVSGSGAPIVVAVAVVNDANALRWGTVELRDGGPGLTDDDLEVAFQRSALHERYRGLRQVGTGLGLAIVHRIVTRMGGTIKAGHAPEGGASFTVALPIPAATGIGGAPPEPHPVTRRLPTS